MSYTVLAVKWRPRNFKTLRGQEHVVQALVNSLEAGRLHHAYLFSGTRGVGKTTVARILAKALNCEEGVTAEPCGKCSACLAIDAGRFVDLIEVDAASRTKVDDTRELLDNVQYAPTEGRFKVYLIDEVHMLSNHSFNALLKTLEEPPPHVKFLFATTDPQKLPVTVLSRCLQFHLKRLTPDTIEEQLAEIVDAEDVTAEAGALARIARAADGSMRDGLSLLDQAIAFSAGSLTPEQVDAMLGTVDRSQVVNILTALAQQNGAGLLDSVAAIETMAPDYGAVLDELMLALQQLATLQVVPEIDPGPDQADLAGLASKLSAEDVQLYYQIALNGRRDLPYAGNPKSALEMTLLRMLAFRPDQGPAKQPREKATGKPKEGVTNPVPTETAPPVADTDWHALVSSMEISGAARQLAEHCALTGVRGNVYDLSLTAGKDSLDRPQLRKRIEAALAALVGHSAKINLTHGGQGDTPAARRRASEDAKASQAREAIAGDPTVQALQSAFDGVVEEGSISPAD